MTLSMMDKLWRLFPRVYNHMWRKKKPQIFSPLDFNLTDNALQAPITELTD